MIAEIPISVISSLIDQPNPENIQYILRSLYLSQSSIAKASKPEITLLTARIINLLNSNEDYKKWYGTHLVQVTASNPIILTTNGQNFIVALLKIINEGRTIPLNLKNASLALFTIIKGIRGKPVLTREILTPNLPSIISSLIMKLDKDIVTILPILQSLVLKNTTTFKPFLTKFETKLIRFLNNENFATFDKTLQKQICTSFAYTHLVSSNHQHQPSGHAIQALPDDQWRLKIFQILSELSSVVEIYDNFIELKEESDLVSILSLLSSKNSDSKNFIFEFLKIDLTEPITIISISKRINVLVQLLIAFVTSPTPFPLRVPLGTIVEAGNLLSSLSLNFISYKRELSRDETIKKIIANDVARSQAIGAELIYEISLTYKRLVLPHIKSVLASLEVIIPVERTKQKSNNKIVKIDEEFALSIESELLQVIKTSVELFKMADGLNEFDLINKLIEVSLLLLKKRTSIDGLFDKQPNKHQESSQQSNKKHKKKNKDSTPLADILSHSELFELEPPRQTVSTVLSFFEIILKKYPKVSTNLRLKIVRYVIGQAVQQNAKNGLIGSKLVKLLEVLVLFPAEGEVYSILPIVKTLLPNNEKLSLLTNPRLPPLETKYTVKKQETYEGDDQDEEEDIDQDIEEVEEVKENFLQDFKTYDETVPSVERDAIFKTDKEIKTLQFAKAKEEEETLKSTRPFEGDEEVPSKRIKTIEESITVTTEVTKSATPEQDEDDESDDDFEIPVIEVDSDEE